MKKEWHQEDGVGEEDSEVASEVVLLVAAEVSGAVVVYLKRDFNPRLLYVIKPLPPLVPSNYLVELQYYMTITPFYFRRRL